MTFRPIFCAFAVSVIGLSASVALASDHPLMAGQSISLPLTEDSEGPVLKFIVAKAELPGTVGFKGETRAQRKARANQILLESMDGQNLVKFVRFSADDLRARYTALAKPQPVTVTASFTDSIVIDNGALWGDALKAGFTFGIAAPSTTPMNWISHIEMTIEGPDGVKATFVCDTITPGRPPRMMNDPTHKETNRMAEEGRKTCYTQIAAKLNGEAAAAAPAATATAAVN